MPDFLHADKDNFSDDELMQEEKIRPQSFRDFAGQKNVRQSRSFRGGLKTEVRARPRSLHGRQVWEKQLGAYYCQ
jgi:hypothetical protein